MNRIYRLIWSRVTNTWVAVSENAKGRGKSGRGAVLRRKAIAAAISLAFAPLAQANPIGAHVVSGTVNINQSGNLLTVTNTPNAIINWQGFSIGSNETTRFIQQSSSSSVLNRVVSANPSELLGTLTSNGKVFLINPAGILVGQGARIDVPEFVASTLNLSNVNFRAGKLNFAANPNAGALENDGNITTPEGGSVYLVAPQLTNNGIITTPKGETILAAGKAVQLVDTGTPGVSVKITGSTTTATNLGQILADSGRIGMVGAVVNNSGTISASSLVSQGGKIFLKATKHVEAGGTLSAEGATGGGDISVMASKVKGTINITGTLDASAPNSGNGGLIETSAKKITVASSATVTTAAAQGLAGSWLLDPYDFNIASSGGDITGAALSTALLSGNVTIQTTATAATCTGAACGTGTSTGTGNINVNDTVFWGANSLTLNAYNNININSTMNGSGTGSLALYYGQGAVALGNTSTYNVNAPVNLPAGQNFSTKLGSDGAVTNYTVITSLGTAGDATTSPATMTLQGMAATANLGGNYVLGANINATKTSTWNANAGFTPIGTSGSNFTGTFDGLGHYIYKLNMNTPAASYVGLFGWTSASSAIRNIGMIAGSTTGQYDVGGLVGVNFGKISNCYVTGSVVGSEFAGGLVGYNYFSGMINNSYATGSVNGTSYYLGGLVGLNYGIINNSYATGSVNGTGTTYHLGGLVGYNGGTTSNSYATGSVNGTYYVGGLAGDNSGTTSNSYATGSVTGSNYVGGLAGINNGTTSNSHATGSVSGTIYVGGLAGINNGTTNNSYATGNVNGTTEVGGLVGYSWGTTSNSYATGNVNGSSYVGGLVGINRGTTSNNYATGSVTGSNYVGGLVGTNYGSINNSYATGSATGSASSFGVGGLVGSNYGSVNNSYSTGSVTAGAYSFAVGGLVGFTNTGTALNSFWNTTTSGQTTSAGGLGLTTAQMQTQANFTTANAVNDNFNPGWDFANVWVMYSGYTNPLLRSFMTPITLTPVYNGTAQTLTNISNYTTNLVNPVTANIISTSAGLTLSSSATAGTEYASLNNFYSNQQGYIISYAARAITGTGSTANSLSIANPISWGAGKLTLYSLGAININANLNGTGTGSLAANARGGAITQAASTAVDVAGTTSLTADNGLAGTSDIKYNITLANTGNNFVGAVTSNGLNISLLDDAGGLILGNTIATGTLTDTSLAGAITQAAATGVVVTGATTLTADNGVAGTGDVKYGITLANTVNKLTGAIVANASTITLYDALAMTVALNSTGATSLTSAGALNVSGTVGTTLTTATTGVASTTTFGATTVGTSLAVTSTGAVTQTATNDVTVAGAATNTTNAHVTVNGVVGALIP